MIELMGWIGAVLFALCAVPQAIHCIRVKSADGLSWSFLMMWLWGEILTLLYVILTSADKILIFNYVFNLACLLVILRYKIK